MKMKLMNLCDGIYIEPETSHREWLDKCNNKIFDFTRSTAIFRRLDLGFLGEHKLKKL